MELLERLEAFVRLRTVGARFAWANHSYRRSGFGEALVEYRDRYKGRPLVIVGNGPSLNRTPMEGFQSIPSLGMNKINLLFSRTTWRPSFILAVNNLVVLQNREFYDVSEIPLLIAYKARRYLGGAGQSRARFFNMFASEEFRTDFSQGVGRCSTVAYACLQFAYYVGANPVILVGIDHNFQHRNKDAGVYEKVEGSDPNHFDPSYFAAGTRWATPDYEMDRRNYARARKAFEADGRRVLDATIEGKLQTFEKIPIEEALKIASGGGQ